VKAVNWRPILYAVYSLSIAIFFLWLMSNAYFNYFFFSGYFGVSQETAPDDLLLVKTIYYTLGFAAVGSAVSNFSEIVYPPVQTTRQKYRAAIYLGAPWLSLLLALFIYIVVRAGLVPAFAGSTAASSGEPGALTSFSYAALGIIVGFGPRNASNKVRALQLGGESGGDEGEPGRDEGEPRPDAH
jgi:hypothetical protein